MGDIRPVDLSPAQSGDWSSIRLFKFICAFHDGANQEVSPTAVRLTFRSKARVAALDDRLEGKIDVRPFEFEVRILPTAFFEDQRQDLLDQFATEENDERQA